MCYCGVVISKGKEGKEEGRCYVYLLVNEEDVSSVSVKKSEEG